MLLFIDRQPSVYNSCSDVSIHLMLLFIQPYSHQKLSADYVSIHLMLLFISSGSFMAIRISSFNTSHVTLYLPVVLPPDPIAVFQYISCYSLSGFRCQITGRWYVSIHLMLLFINTLKFVLPCSFLFQYISCYSLSLVFPIFSLLTFFIISQNTRVCNIFPKQHRLFESFHRSTPKPYIFTTFHIFL